MKGRAAECRPALAHARRWSHAGRPADALALRVPFAAEPEDEAEVRLRIARGLRRGHVEGAPAPSRWTVLSASASELREDERAPAERLVALP